jgi:isopentenyldiphosphate isomerase
VLACAPDGARACTTNRDVCLPVSRLWRFAWADSFCPLVLSPAAAADAMGVKNAARRKLEHELGIPPEDVPVEDFTWLTRVHYMGER